jgi:hypothetical protein
MSLRAIKPEVDILHLSLIARDIMKLELRGEARYCMYVLRTVQVSRVAISFALPGRRTWAVVYAPDWILPGCSSS